MRRWLIPVRRFRRISAKLIPKKMGTTGLKICAAKSSASTCGDRIDASVTTIRTHSAVTIASWVWEKVRRAGEAVALIVPGLPPRGLKLGRELQSNTAIFLGVAEKNHDYAQGNSLECMSQPPG